ncbi:homogentisate 1,2-dioxygenase, partial [Rosenbergiella epipactidis]|uniref:homogentisate 1,2-dioxygenase n=1 Tax=Rosenbergiella epipactidis TaxID=1544694 RepID=UPI001F4F434E
IRPTVAHWGRFTEVDAGLWRSAPDDAPSVPIGPLRWDPVPMPDDARTLLTGVATITTGGDVAGQTGFANHVFRITASMVDEYFYNADAEMLFVL